MPTPHKPSAPPPEDCGGHVCELCGRCVDIVTLHHLYPRSQGKRRKMKASDLPTAWLCAACHRQLHTLFTNKELASKFSTVEQLRADPAAAKFIEWIARQDPNKRVKVRR